MVTFAVNFLSIAYSLIPLIIVGLYGYHVFNAFYKLFFAQALMTAVLYAIVAADFTAGNHLLFNGYIALDFAMIMGAAVTVMTKRSERWWILAGFLVFTGTYIADLVLQGPGKLTNHAIAAGAVPVLIIYLTLLYRFAQDKATRPMIWLCFGLVLYFCCNAPFLALLSFIQTHYATLSAHLQLYILEPLGHLRYLLAALSFWLYLQATRRSTPTESVWPKER